MSHDTHQSAPVKGPKTPISSAFWLVLVLVFLFISAVNFVNVMSHDEGEGHGEATHEVTTGHEASAGEHAPAATHEEGH